MIFFIDHDKRRIHKSICMGEECDFTDTAPEEREYSNSNTYILSLEKEKNYSKCPECEAFSQAIG